MWVSSQSTNQTNSFRDTYTTKIRSYLENDNDFIDLRTPILSSPYDWKSIEAEINNLISGKTPQHLYPMIPSYSIENSVKGRRERLQLLLYGLSHMTEDAIFIGDIETYLSKIQEIQTVNLDSDRPTKNVNLLFFFMVLFIIILGIYLWNTSMESNASSKTWLACIVIILLIISLYLSYPYF